MKPNPNSKRYVLGAAVGKNQYDYVGVRAKARDLSVSDYVRKLIDIGMSAEDAQAVRTAPSATAPTAGIDSVLVRVTRLELDYISAQSRAKGMSISNYLHDVLERGFAEMQPEPEVLKSPTPEQAEAKAQAPR